MSSSQFRDSNFGNRIRFPIHVQPQFNQDWNFEKLVAKSENWGPPLARSINNRPCKLEVASTFLASLPYIILHIANLRSFLWLVYPPTRSLQLYPRCACARTILATYISGSLSEQQGPCLFRTQYMILYLYVCENQYNIQHPTTWSLPGRLLTSWHVKH